MEAFGGSGERVETVDQVEGAVRRAFAARRPCLLDVVVRGVRSPFTEWQIAGKSPPR
jgi:thiamine pyrophosphate-dependent acetolactate synthase large subunit-like protein